jgi:hypothetical protein
MYGDYVRLASVGVRNIRCSSSPFKLLFGVSTCALFTPRITVDAENRHAWTDMRPTLRSPCSAPAAPLHQCAATTPLSAMAADTAARPGAVDSRDSVSMLGARVSSCIAQVCRLRRQKEQLMMLLERAQTNLQADLEALCIARANESLWWRDMEHEEQVSYLRHASTVLGKAAPHDFLSSS